MDANKFIAALNELGNNPKEMARQLQEIFLKIRRMSHDELISTSQLLEVMGDVQPPHPLIPHLKKAIRSAVMRHFLL